ncbi:MAG: RHS repeat-associated core domain-containing protein, partial [Thermoanaerobaculia bacterium]|nr:RHS repeat-associated core domain-containing protein [Thermoanaerobaculia bacterium]
GWELLGESYTLRSSEPLAPGAHAVRGEAGLPLDLAGKGLEQVFEQSFSVAAAAPTAAIFAAPDARVVPLETLANRFTFQGRSYDPETGFFYFRNRDYDPELGRFITADPLGNVDGPSSYQLALNNPVDFSDPFGLAVIEKGDVRHVQEELARKRQEALQRLLASAERYLLAHRGESEEQIRMGLAQYLRSEGFISGPIFEAHDLTVALLGPGQCDGSQHVICHFEGMGTYARAMELVAINASMLALGELAAVELVAAGPSYAAMLGTIQADVRFARILQNLQLSREARTASNFGAYLVRERTALGGATAPTGLRADVLRLIERNLMNTGDTVLGSYPGYINKANARGASYFDIGDAWQGLSDAERWAANRYFLDTVASRGDRILLSTPKLKIQPNTWLAREVEYLTQRRNYVWINQWSLRPGS